MTILTKLDFYAYNSDGYTHDGYNRDGFNLEGFDRNGFDEYGFDRDGFNHDGFDADGFNRDGFDADGFNRKGFGADGFNREGFDDEGFNREGFGADGFNRDGFNADGFNREGIEAVFDENGFDDEGFDRRGFDTEGFNRRGFDHKGINRAGIGRIELNAPIIFQDFCIYHSYVCSIQQAEICINFIPYKDEFITSNECVTMNTNLYYDILHYLSIDIALKDGYEYVFVRIRGILIHQDICVHRKFFSQTLYLKYEFVKKLAIYSYKKSNKPNRSKLIGDYFLKVMENYDGADYE